MSAVLDDTFISESQNRIEKLFAQYIKELDSPAPLLQSAMAYAVFNGGKRVRPLLVYATGLALGAKPELMDAPAAAIELIHAYSLIHDDLPAMDNADTRRGMPSCHKKFGEAMAILAGDALQTLAFRIIIVHPGKIATTQRLKMLDVLTDASGIMGMAGGQALDMVPKDKSLESILEVYKLKTGALLSASVKLGMVAANLTDPTVQSQLENYAACMGLAFQLQDDLLDLESETSIAGKPVGLDAINEKITYPSIVGAIATRQKVHTLINDALASLTILGARGEILAALAQHLLRRVK
jgi:farnesyl diphosphate synthase